MYASRFLLALFVALVLEMAAGSSWKHAVNETSLSTERRLHFGPGYARGLESSLRTPLAVYTLPLKARVTLTPQGMSSLDQVFSSCSANEENAIATFASQAVYRPLGYIKYSNNPEMVLKYFLIKATWNDAQMACAGDGAALYTFDHPAQLDSTMANFYPLLMPWVDMQKPRVDGGSMLCGYLHGPVSGKSSLRWDDCNAMHEFICQKSANTSTKSTSLHIRGKPTITLRTSFVTLPDFINAFTTETQAFYNLVNPALSMALLSPTLTHAQKTEITNIMAQWENFDFVVMPDVHLMITTTPILSAVHMRRIQSAASDGLSLYNQLQVLSNSYSSQLTPILGQSLPLLSMIGESIAFYNVLASIVSNPLAQPKITAAQAMTLNDAIAQIQNLYDDAIISFNVVASSPPTGAPKIAATPIPPLGQIIQTLATTSQTMYSMALPFIAMANPLTLSPSVASQMQALSSLGYKYSSTTLPNIVAMLTANPILTPAQVQQLQDDINQGILLQTSGQCFGGYIASFLNLSPDLQKALTDNVNTILAMYTGLQSVVNLSNNLPEISTAQSLQLQNLLSQYQGSVSSVAKGFPTGSSTTAATTTVATTSTTKPPTTTPTTAATTTTKAPTTSTTTKPATTTQKLTPAERNTIIVQIHGYMGQIDALLLLLLSPPVTIRTTATQRSQPAAVINKLLTLRSRQAEIEALVTTMSAHEQKRIAIKLAASRGSLRNMVADRRSFAQYLTVLPGNIQPITQLLEHTVEILKPFF